MLSPVKIWRNQKKIASSVGKIGRVVSWTIVRTPPARFSNQAPYPVVLVQLEHGGRIAAQLVDWKPQQLAFGQRVQTVVRRVVEPTVEDIIPYGIKVKPI